MPNKNCGLLLSGGMDSSLICALMGKAGKRFKTYTGGCLDKKIDDSKWAEYYDDEGRDIDEIMKDKIEA